LINSSEVVKKASKNALSLEFKVKGRHKYPLLYAVDVGHKGSAHKPGK
jgi:hypothetical protein